MILALLGMRGPVVRRTALLASSAAVMWALVATLVKTMTDTLTEFGVWGMFAHWPVYALAGAGLGAEVVHQTALRVGPLSVSQPLLVIVNPIVSIALSVWIFQEHFTQDATRLAVGSVAFAVMCASVVMLTRTAPPTMSAHNVPQTSPASATPSADASQQVSERALGESFGCPGLQPFPGRRKTRGRGNQERCRRLPVGAPCKLSPCKDASCVTGTLSGCF